MPDDSVVELARDRELRVDTTAVETEIHHPSACGLIRDRVRVVTRRQRRARALPREAAARLGGSFWSRVRIVRKLAQPLHRCAD